MKNTGYEAVNSFDLDVVLDRKIIKSYPLNVTFEAGEIKKIDLTDIPLNYSGDQQEFAFVIKEINNEKAVPNNLENEVAISDITHNGEVFKLSVTRNAQNVNMGFQVVNDGQVLSSFNANNYSEDDGSNYNYSFCLVSDCYEIVTQDLLVEEGCTIQDWDANKEYSGIGLQVMYEGKLYKGLSTIIPAGSNPVSSGFWYTLNETCPGTNGALSYRIYDATNTELHNVTVAQYTGTSIHEICNDREETYVVHYNGNGNDTGIIPSNNKQYITGEQVTIGSKESLKKTGYTFVGWNTEADGTGDSYSFADQFIISSNVTLYAQWDKVTEVLDTFSQSVVLYPNPTEGLMTIKASGEFLARLTNINGQQIDAKEAINNSITFNISTLTSGVYLVVITNAEGAFIKRVTKL